MKPQTASAHASVSFVIPCLNEEKTLPLILEKIRTLRQSVLKNRDTEVIVSDNGSTDRSVEIALEYGAKIVHCNVRGYGAALQHGIREATGEVVIFADADNTYDFLQAPALIEKIAEGHDFVLGSRLKGTIEQGAMPFLHRYLGTPVLNAWINFLYAKKGFRISDCNSGFRCFRRDSFLLWEVRSTGMEFASEMLVKALTRGARISEVPIKLSPHASDRTPHLKTWRDGMRHLLQILLEAPQFFFWAGAVTFLLSWGLMLASLLVNNVDLGFASVLGIHTTAFAFLGSLAGLTIWSIGLFLSIKRPSKNGIYQFLINLSEDRLFWFSAVYTLLSFALIAGVLVRWAANGFAYLSLEKQTVVLSAFIANGLLLVSNIFTTHLMKRA